MDPTPMTESEMMALAGLARAIMGLDGRITEEEQRAVLEIRFAITEGAEEEGTPYRGGVKATPLSAERWQQILERAGDELAGETALQEAAAGVKRKRARDAIYALLTDIAIVDGVSGGEWHALEWLEHEWSIEPRDVE